MINSYEHYNKLCKCDVQPVQCTSTIPESELSLRGLHMSRVVQVPRWRTGSAGGQVHPDTHISGQGSLGEPRQVSGQAGPHFSILFGAMHEPVIDAS